MSIDNPTFGQPKKEEPRPEYRLGFDEASESRGLPRPYEMTYEQFRDEFERAMEAIRAKEKKGRLDPGSQPYEPLSKEEWELMAKGWKAFSRGRGFSEEDIQEYERWLVLSGQRDDLLGSINDPWRRPERLDHDKQIYLRHIEKAMADGKEIPEDVSKSFNQIKESLSDPMARFRRKPNMLREVPDEETGPPTANNASESDDIW